MTELNVFFFVFKHGTYRTASFIKKTFHDNIMKRVIGGKRPRFRNLGSSGMPQECFSIESLFVSELELKDCLVHTAAACFKLFGDENVDEND